MNYRVDHIDRINHEADEARINDEVNAWRKEPHLGHESWDHWNVSLWIGSDESTYFRAVELIQNSDCNRATEVMLEELPSHTPDGAEYTYETVRAAIEGIDS